MSCLGLITGRLKSTLEIISSVLKWGTLLNIKEGVKASLEILLSIFKANWNCKNLPLIHTPNKTYHKEYLKENTLNVTEKNNYI